MTNPIAPAAQVSGVTSTEVRRGRTAERSGRMGDQASFARSVPGRGAVAFIQKTVDPGDLAGAIRQAIAGNVHYAAGQDTPLPQPKWDLTSREVDVLRALAAGQSNKQIAKEFWLSSHTIKYHLTNIYRKLEVSGRTEAVRQAYEHGLIENSVLRSTVAVA
jgi:DNA-binding NarL/FixJ family response regulator